MFLLPNGSAAAAKGIERKTFRSRRLRAERVRVDLMVPAGEERIDERKVADEDCNERFSAGPLSRLNCTFCPTLKGLINGQPR